LSSCIGSSCTDSVIDWEAPCYLSDVFIKKEVLVAISRKTPKKGKSTKNESSHRKSVNLASELRCSERMIVPSSSNEQDRATDAEDEKTSGHESDGNDSDTTYVPSLHGSMDSTMTGQGDIKPALESPKINTRLVSRRIQLDSNRDHPSPSGISPHTLPGPFPHPYHYMSSVYATKMMADYTTAELMSIPPQMASPDLTVDFMTASYPPPMDTNYQYSQYPVIQPSLGEPYTLLSHLP
jgi:hypothetical protein